MEINRKLLVKFVKSVEKILPKARIGNEDMEIYDELETIKKEITKVPKFKQIDLEEAIANENKERSKKDA